MGEGRVLEADLQRAIIAWLRRSGIEYWRMPLGPVLHGGGRKWGENPLKGFPDVAGLLQREQPGRFWAIEIKSDTGRVSQEQAAWILRLKYGGAAVTVVKSLAEVEHFFRGLGEID